MPIYNLLEYSKNYPKTSVFLWNYYRDELTDYQFTYKTNITGITCHVPRRKTDQDGNNANNPNYVSDKRVTKQVKISVSLKHLGNFLERFKYTISQL